MNKIILLGHPFSGLSGVEGLLQASGMQAALPSKREGLLPQHITDTLCQAHGCAPLEQAMTEADLAPLQAGAVWHGLALDLLLGNLQQPLWGWADARSIYWLDYWAGLDLHLTFVMVYNHPAHALQASGAALLQGQHGSPPDMALQQMLENWQAYNGAMLQFYSRHPGRCLLVNAQRAREQLADYLQQLGTQLHSRSPLALELTASAGANTHEGAGGNTLALAIEQGGGPEHLLQQWFGTDNLLERHLLELLLQDHPPALQIYQELEAAATVRSHQLPSAQATNPAQAWIQLIEQRQAMAALTLSLYEQLQEQQQRYLSIQTQLEQAQNEKSAPVLPQPQVKELEEENELLLAQLHQVQEELERYYLENQDLKKNHTKTKPKPYGAADRVKQHLSYRLGTTMIAHSSSLSGWVRMPFALLSQAREHSRSLKAQAGQPQPPLHTYADAYEAERCKQHLSYQLGQTLLKHIKTPWGWVWMPFALVGTVRSFRKARA